MRGIVLLLVVAALAAGIWFLASSAGTTPVPVGVTSDGSVGDPAVGPALVGDRAEPEEPIAVTESEFERSEIEATEASAASKSELLRILVTQRETGEPVPGAEVAYVGNVDVDYQELSPEEQEEYQRLARDPERHTRHYGKTVLADSEGVAFISVAQEEQYVQVTGRNDQLYGQMTLRPDTFEEDADREFKLELDRDLTLTVQVLDSLARPAVDVPVGIVPDGALGSVYYNREMATTEAPRGLARIPHLQITVRQWKQQEDDLTGALVRANIPGLTEGGESFDAENPPEDPIVLRLPPTGRVVLEARGADGERIPSMLGNLSFTIAPEDPPADLARYSAPPGERWYRQPEKDGTTVFERVVAGKDYLAIAYLSGESVAKIFPGPIGEGREVRETLSATTQVYSLVGRVVDEDGKPVRNSLLRAAYETERGNGSRAVRTDDEGRFGVIVGREGREMTLNKLTILFESVGPQPSDPTSMFILRGIRRLELGKNDLGDVVLGSSPLVAAGSILVDGEVPDGQRFGLQVERLDVRQTSSRTTERWSLDRGLAVRILEEGRFEIRGVSRPARYRVGMGRNRGLGSGSRLDFLPMDPIEFAPGWDDLQIRLETGGTLQAVVLTDDVLSAQNLQLRVAAVDGSVPEENLDPILRRMPYENRLYGQYRGEQDGRHMFRWGALGAGVYRLEVLPRGARAPVVTVEDVEVTGGDGSKDPRLDGIDLRGKLRRIVVTVEDTEGKRIPDTNFGPPVVLIHDPTAEEAYGFSARNGRATIITADPYLDLLVDSRGYLRKELYGVREDTTVALEPLPEILIRIADGLPELPDGHSLRVTVTQKGRPRDTRPFISDFVMGATMDGWFYPPTPEHDVNERGEMALQVEGEGTYEVRVTLRTESPVRVIAIRGIEPAEIEVRNLVGRPVFQIRIPEEELKQALERAGR